jgi:ribosomal protein L24
VVLAGRTRFPLKADRVVQGNRMGMAGQVFREVVPAYLEVLAGRTRLPLKADRVVQGNRMDMAGQVVREVVVQGNRMGMAGQVVPVFREDLEVPVDRTRLPLKADRVVQGNRMGMAGQVVPVFREDLEVQVDRKDLAGRAGLSKQGPLAVPAKVASTGSRRNARRTLTCVSANSSRSAPLRPLDYIFLAASAAALFSHG